MGDVLEEGLRSHEPSHAPWGDHRRRVQRNAREARHRRLGSGSVRRHGPAFPRRRSQDKRHQEGALLLVRLRHGDCVERCDVRAGRRQNGRRGAASEQPCRRGVLARHARQARRAAAEDALLGHGARRHQGCRVDLQRRRRRGARGQRDRLRLRARDARDDQGSDPAERPAHRRGDHQLHEGWRLLRLVRPSWRSREEENVPRRHPEADPRGDGEREARSRSEEASRGAERERLQEAPAHQASRHGREHARSARPPDAPERRRRLRSASTERQRRRHDDHLHHVHGRVCGLRVRADVDAQPHPERAARARRFVHRRRPAVRRRGGDQRLNSSTHERACTPLSSSRCTRAKMGATEIQKMLLSSVLLLFFLLHSKTT